MNRADMDTINTYLSDRRVNGLHKDMQACWSWLVAWALRGLKTGHATVGPLDPGHRDYAVVRATQRELLRLAQA